MKRPSSGFEFVRDSERVRTGPIALGSVIESATVAEDASSDELQRSQTGEAAGVSFPQELHCLSDSCIRMHYR
jgi:hypothetical protein